MLEKFNIEAKRYPQILLAPLDWGLGHATRCIPLIRYLIENGCEVIIAAEGKQMSLLQQEFPSLRMVNLRGYKLQYSDNRWKTIVKIIAQVPKILQSARREHRWLKRFSKEKRIDAVISDNRYGFFLQKVPSIFITHQLAIKTPFGKTVDRLVRFINYRAIKNFTACWVPDLEGENNLGGELSHPGRLPPVNLRFIGPLSRFNNGQPGTGNKLILILVSGPEPQRSIFESIVISQISQISEPLVMIRGLPGEPTELNVSGEEIKVFNHLPAKEMADLISEACLVISRPGYSTVMEMMLAGKECIFIPTPGQSEQEYLARYLSGKNLCLTASQDSFSLPKLLEQARTKQFSSFHTQPGVFEEVMESFVASLKLQ